MTIEDVKNLVQGEFVCGEDMKSDEISCVFASDLMSDVLTLKNNDNLLLLTGLCNMQSIRTCEMSDINYMLVVRGKQLTDEMLELAKENGMAIVTTSFSMFKAAGLLYEAGLPPVY